jgi:hypothetical protein
MTPTDTVLLRPAGESHGKERQRRQDRESELPCRH